MSKPIQAMTPGELRTAIHMTEGLIRSTRTRLSNQERKLLDLKLVLLERLEGSSEDQSG